MNIRVNGENRDTESKTVAALLTELNLLPAQVAVEYNQTVLFRHELEKAQIREGDQIEIIRVVAGG